MSFKKLILIIGVCSLSFTSTFAGSCGSATKTTSSCSSITSQSSCSQYYIANECVEWGTCSGSDCDASCLQYANVQCIWGTGSGAYCYNGGQKCDT
jgi:hypothetical protein